MLPSRTFKFSDLKIPPQTKKDCSQETAAAHISKDYICFQSWERNKKTNEINYAGIWALIYFNILVNSVFRALAVVDKCYTKMDGSIFFCTISPNFLENILKVAIWRYMEQVQWLGQDKD